MLGLAIFAGAAFLMNSREYRPRYLATVLANPLGFIVRAKGTASFSDDQRQKLNRFVKLGHFEWYYSPVDILPFHNGAIRPSTTPDDFAAFRSASVDIFFENYQLVLRNRWNMFLHLTNIKRGTHISYDGSRRVQRMNLPAANLQFFDKGEFTPFQVWHKSFFYKYMCELPNLARWLLASALIPILAMIGMLFGFRRRAAYAILAAVLLFRLCFVAALTPASYFKYGSSVWLGGWMLLFILLAEERRPSAKV